MIVDKLIENLQESGLEVTYYSTDDDFYSHTVVINEEIVLRITSKGYVRISNIAKQEETMFCKTYLDLCHAQHSYRWPFIRKNQYDELVCSLTKKNQLNKVLTRDSVKLQELYHLNLKNWFKCN